ncbi:MAG: hypothetical protein KC547_14735, partial [Anaerolineae bacterium]|nr:hypothetical protein [Anaerolineae bacterium]
VDRSVSGAEWSPDETKVLFWALDRVYVWQPEQDEVYSIGEGADVNGATWSRDGKYILTWTAGGKTEIVLADPESLIALARSRARRELSNAERAQFFLPTLVPTATDVPD